MQFISIALYDGNLVYCCIFLGSINYVYVSCCVVGVNDDNGTNIAAEDADIAAVGY